MKLNCIYPHIHKYTVALIVLGLVCSFGLHTVQVTHEHFGEQHTHNSDSSSRVVILGEYMHLTDKKLFLIPLFLATVLWGYIDVLSGIRERLLTHALQCVTSLRQKSRERYNFFEYLDLYFKRGILHTKVY